jgi:hypothetical protein
MSDETDFDWSPLGAEWWAEAQATCGAKDLQTRFACLRHRGMTASGAARSAGYAGDVDSIRQAGSRAAKSTAVLNLLAMAAAETGDGDDGVVSRDEARRILSRLARGSDPNVRIKALESLNKIEVDAERARASKSYGSAEDIIREMLTLGGLLTVLALYLQMLKDNHTSPPVTLTALPLFGQLAPTLSKSYPAIWIQLLDELDGGSRADAERFAAGPAIPIEAIVSKPAGTAAAFNGFGGVEEVAEDVGI